MAEKSAFLPPTPSLPYLQEDKKKGTIQEVQGHSKRCRVGGCQEKNNNITYNPRQDCPFLQGQINFNIKLHKKKFPFDYKNLI